MPRRDAFSHLRQAEPSPVIPPDPVKQPETGNAIPVPATQPLDLIPIASRKPKRNRDWDRAHQPEKVTYRGIPMRLQETISDLAANLNVPRDELVRALLEYSVADLQANRLILVAHPKAQRMTLFPPGDVHECHLGKRERSSAAAWLDQAFPTTGHGQPSPPKKKRGKDQRKKQRWESRATYRLPVRLKEQVKGVADEHDVPVGELVLFFLDRGLGAYQRGDLRSDRTPRASGKTLFLGE